MAVLIPKNVASLAKLCAKENPRYAVTGVRVIDSHKATYRLEATDGRVLGVIQGSCPGMEPEPHVPENAVIVAKDWLAGCKMATPKESVLLTLNTAQDVCTFETGKGSATAAQLDGRFPPVNEAFPKKPAMISVDVDPGLLIRVLEVAKALELERVTLHFYRLSGGGLSAMLGISGNNEQGQFYDGLCVPLELPKKKGE
jgi:hypothetical protein